ncbi:hypothetical protein L1987_80062 [Smallanthus sonchifolius]|uniref:Uncharacterized protein n=1 Tax=Smallanthus sonchifolius TaxID=185202 RepID=A0ACB8YLK4_9ASTR|nr:hypothetical protein L1987_80062 [Smallanthus sonchifolius]
MYTTTSTIVKSIPTSVERERAYIGYCEMAGRGGACIARYSGGGGGVFGEMSYGMSKTPDRKENSVATCSPSENPDLLTNRNKLSPILLSFNNQQPGCDGDLIASRSPPPQKSVVTSFVIMECVTETWTGGDGLGFSDQARVMSMEMDTCPSFITNSRDTVVWTNKAYREMTAGGGSGETVLVVVKKFNKVTMPVSHPVFTCKVKVTWGTEREGTTSPLSVTAPCDVWRLRSGGYAWRLDVKSALSLGRPISQVGCRHTPLLINPIFKRHVYNQIGLLSNIFTELQQQYDSRSSSLIVTKRYCVWWCDWNRVKTGERWRQRRLSSNSSS